MYSTTNTLQAFGGSYPLQRHIGKSEGNYDGECVVFFGSIHGNEPSGFVALNKFFTDFEKYDLHKKLRGSIFGIAGNLTGLKANTRFVKNDLNRIWTPSIMKRVYQQSQSELHDEELEQKELLNIIDHLVNTRKSHFNFVDLHTTSGPTIPFVTINDTIANRKLAGHLPIPTVLGIEEFLEGTIMDFINDLGYPAIGLESGQHCDEKSVALHLASIWVTLVAIGSLDKNDIPNYQSHFNLLQEAAGEEASQVYEVKHREVITKEDDFKMNHGFLNFQSISRRQSLAVNKRGTIKSKRSGKIFMPLYQSQGSEGFFEISEIKQIWLNLSMRIRKGKFESFLTSLPGIHKEAHKCNVLVVNKVIARFFTTDFMHLLGYRKVQRQGSIVCFTKREIPEGNWPYYLRK